MYFGSSESTRMRMGNSIPHCHQDHIAGKRESSLQHYNFVHNFVPVPQALKIPAAKAAVDKDFFCAKKTKNQCVNNKRSPVPVRAQHIAQEGNLTICAWGHPAKERQRERIRNHAPQHGAPSARPRRSNLLLENVRHAADFRGDKTSQKLVCLHRELPPTSAATTKRRARPPFAGQLWIFTLLRSPCFFQSNAIPVCCMAPGGPIRPDGGHQSGINCLLGASPQRESVSDDFQSPATQLVKRAKVEVAHHDVGADSGANLAANPCHFGLHRVTTVA